MVTRKRQISGREALLPETDHPAERLRRIYRQLMPKLTSVWDECTRDLPMIEKVTEYRGESAIAVAATQRSDVTRTEAALIVHDWVEFFSTGPTPIRELHFVTRTPKRLFDALRSQTQLEKLILKWGDYDDLRPIESLNLRVLRLGGASRITSVAPLARLTTLTHLEVESLWRAHDLSPLVALQQLRQLEFGGDWMAPRTAHIDSIGWLPHLARLEHLLIHTLIVDDLDYSPILRLPALRAVRVMAARGMGPSLPELKKRLPWEE